MFIVLCRAHAVYYKNVAPKSTSGLPAPDVVCPPSSMTHRDWYLLETNHENNEAFFRRSKVWRYTGKPTRLFKEVGDSNEDTESIMHRDFQSSVISEPVDEKTCVEPATYYLQPKENNLCLCTFWHENLETWQVHYGRASSCVSPPPMTMPFRDYFKMEVFPTGNSKEAVIVRVYTVPAAILDQTFILHAVYIQGDQQR